MRSALVAVQFLTRIPVPGGDRPADTDTLRRAVGFFPLVGGLIGLITASLAWGAGQLWSPLLAALLALAAEAAITGAFHEDAVADSFDAFGGGWTREDVLRILKDSRLGTYGALALFLAVAVRAVAVGELIALDTMLLFVTVVASAALGRAAIVVLMAWVPPVTGRESLARDVGQRVGAGILALAIAWTLPIVAVLATLRPWHTFGALLVIGVLITGMRRLLLRRLGGVTGDALGCLGYLAQLAVLVVVLVDWPGAQ
ncbi:MAG: adenosylcobinamide-GDP ribazoletransferase [Acidobacteriota bacterium]